MNARGMILYGAGQLGIMLLTRYFFQWVIRFADVGKETGNGPLFAAGIVGALFFAFRIFDAVTDPIAGDLGDRWVAAGRERRTLLWMALLIPAIGLILVFAPHAAMSPLVRWTLLFSGMVAFFTGYTLYAIPYWSLLEDYSQGNERTRTSLSNVLGLGILVATGIGFIVSPLLVDRLGFFKGSVVFGLVGTILMALPYFASPKNVVVKVPQTRPKITRSLVASLSHSRFVAVVLLFAGAHMSLTIMTAAAPYIAERLLNGKLSDVALLLGPFLATAVFTFALVPRFSRKYGWERATLVGAVVLSLAYIGAGLLGKGIIGSPLQTAMIVFAIAGPGSAFILGLEGEAVARCAQRSTYKSTGMYFGVYNLIVKALNGLSLFITGLLASEGSLWAIRAMPILAGVLSVAGVVVYVLAKKTDPDDTATELSQAATPAS